MCLRSNKGRLKNFQTAFSHILCIEQLYANQCHVLFAKVYLFGPLYNAAFVTIASFAIFTLRSTMLQKSAHRPIRIAPLAAMILLLVVVIAIIGALVHFNGSFAFEPPLMLWLHLHTPPIFAPLAVALNFIGLPTTATEITVCIGLYHIMRHQLNWAVFIWLSVICSTFVSDILKVVFNRPRPMLWPRLVEATHASFPSGHSAFAASMAVLAVLYCYTNSRKLPWVLAVGFALLMGFSRVYLGVHFPTDVLAGWSIGAVCPLSFYCFFNHRLQTR